VAQANNIVDLRAGSPPVPAAEVGRKAATLQVLASAGLPVPPALALPWRSLPARDISAIESAVAPLGELLAVRSSANLEDLPEGAAPGLFESRAPVQLSALESAIAQVEASGRTPLVEAYLRARGIPTEARVSVIVQRYVAPTVARGVLYTSSIREGGQNEALIECAGCTPITIHKDHEVVELPVGAGLSAEQALQLWSLGQRVEAVLGKGLDIEWVWGEEGPCIVQARAIVALSRERTAPDVSELTAFSRAEPSRVWKLDASHNPAPLSPAQAGLVKLVADIAPYRSRIVGGYLYTSSDPRPAPAHFSIEDVEKLYAETILPQAEEALAELEASAEPELEAALEGYRRVFDLYVNQLGPALSAARAATPELSHGSNPLTCWLQLAKAGRIDRDELLKAISPLAPAWDVVVPTYGETPESVDRALARLPQSAAVEECSISVAEADDVLFFRAQRCVRRALVALAPRLHLSEREIFFVDLDRLRRGETTELKEEARRNMAEHRRQAQIEMPLRFANGQALARPAPSQEDLWKGLGTGGYAEGTVLRLSDLAEIPQLVPEVPTVLVMPTVSPAHAIAAVGAAALVCEYGEHLGHGAAMARELDIPCVVSCHRAWRDLRTGDRVAVHGEAGLVARLTTSAA
jgi:pyruvate,water dikinase